MYLNFRPLSICRNWEVVSLSFTSIFGLAKKKIVPVRFCWAGGEWWNYIQFEGGGKNNPQEHQSDDHFVSLVNYNSHQNWIVDVVTVCHTDARENKSRGKSGMSENTSGNQLASTEKNLRNFKFRNERKSERKLKKGGHDNRALELTKTARRWLKGNG